MSLEVGAAQGANLVHDEKADGIALAMALATLEPPLPQAFGVLRAVDRPTLEDLALTRYEQAARAKGPASLDDLIASGDVWTVS